MQGAVGVSSVDPLSRDSEKRNRPHIVTCSYMELDIIYKMIRRSTENNKKAAYCTVLYTSVLYVVGTLGENSLTILFTGNLIKLSQSLKVTYYDRNVAIW